MAGLAHFGFGFAAKPLAPRVPLAAWLAGSQLIDLLAITLPLVGLEKPDEAYWSHSLLMAGVWGLVFGLAVGGFSRDLKAGLLGFAVVFAHWMLDALVWPMAVIYPDKATVVMPFLPGDPAGIGLGLYRSVAAVAIVEPVLFLGGAAAYAVYRIRLRRRRPGGGTPPGSVPSIS